MDVQSVTFSPSGQHLEDLREALNLQSVPHVLDLSQTLVSARQVISPLEDDHTTRLTGAVILVSDYPLTGKSCLAFNLVRDWLSTALVLEKSEPLALILSPESQADWSKDKMEVAIRSVVGEYPSYVKALVVIDNLERCMSDAGDLDRLLSWLLTPQEGYHKLLLYTDGVVCDRKSRILFEEKLESLSALQGKKGSNHQWSMRFSPVADLEKLNHLFAYRASKHFHLTEPNATRKTTPDLASRIAIDRSDGGTSYLVGLVDHVQQQSASASGNGFVAALAETKAVRKLREHVEAWAVLRILSELCEQYSFSAREGFSVELVGKLFAGIAAVGWIQYEVVLDTLQSAGIILLQDGMIKTSELWLMGARHSARPLFGGPTSLDTALGNAKADVVSASAWLQVMAIDLARDDLIGATYAFFQCVETPLRQVAIHRLAHYVNVAVNASIFLGKQQEIQVDDFVFRVLSRINTLFASVNLPDSYSVYENGLNKMMGQIEPDHPQYTEIYVYKQRITENISDSRRFGDTEARRAERNQIVYQLNKLSLSMLNMPFDKLCGQVEPKNTMEVTGSLAQLVQNEHAKPLRFVVDEVMTQLCELASSQEFDFWPTLQTWRLIADYGLKAGHTLVSAALGQGLLLELDIPDWPERILSALPILHEQADEKAKEFGLPDFASLVAPVPHSKDEIQIMVSRFCQNWFPRQVQLALDKRVGGDLWEQSLEMATRLSELRDTLPGEDDFETWLLVAMDEVVRDLETSEKSIAVLVWASEALVSCTLQKEEVYRLLGALSCRIKPGLFFQVCLASIGRSQFAQDGNKRSLKHLFDSILQVTEYIGRRDRFEPAFQACLAFYTLCLQFAYQGGWPGAKDELSSHMASIDALLSQYAEEILVIDRLQWERNYRQIISVQAILMLKAASPDSWQTMLCHSYIVALNVHDNLGWTESVDALIAEGLVFSRLYGLTNESTKQLAQFRGARPSGLDDRNMKQQTSSRHSALSCVDQRRWQPVLARLSRGRIGEAMTTLYHHLKTSLVDPEAWYLFGLCWLHRDDLLSLTCFRTACALAPEFVGPYLRIAEIHHRLENTKSEIAALSQAFAVNSEHFLVCLRLARAHRHAEQYEEAIEFYHRASQLGNDSEPDSDKIPEELADLYHARNEWIEALEHYWEAMRLRPFEKGSLLAMLEVVRELSEREQLRYLDRKLDHVRLMRCLLRHLRPLISSYEDGVKMAAACFFIGARESAWDVLIELFKQGETGSTQLHPLNVVTSSLAQGGQENTAAFYSGLSHLGSDRYEEAAEQFSEILDHSPGDYEVRYFLAKSYAALASVQRELNLGEGIIRHNASLALREGLRTLFQGMYRESAHDLLGSIYCLRGAEHTLFYQYAIDHWEEACLSNPTALLVARIANARFDMWMTKFPHNAPVRMRDWLESMEQDVLTWLHSHAQTVGDSTSQGTLLTALGAFYVRTCAHLSQSAGAELQTIEHLFAAGEEVLQRAAKAEPAGLDVHLHLGKLYWEWQCSADSTEKRRERIEHAIQCWEEGQQATRDSRLPRIKRTIREELEISIGNALKELRGLASE